MYGNGLSRNSDIAAANAAIAQQAAGDELRGVDSDGEADSLSRQNGGGIDADYTPRRVHQRPTRVAGVQGSIGLNHVIDQAPGIRPQRSPERAHYTRGNGGLKTIGCANG